MELLEQLLSSAKRNPQTVIAGLLGVLIAGTVGGSLWIHSLQTVIDSHESIERQEIAAVKERYETDLAAIRARVANLEVVTKKQQEVVDESIGQIDTLSQSRSLPPDARMKLLRVRDNLKFSRIAVQSEHDVLAAQLPPPPAFERRTPWFGIVLILVTLLGVIWGVTRLIRGKRRSGSM